MINIPNTVTNILGGALYSCDYIKTLKIPSSVTTIGKNAFPKLVESIYIPSSVTIIESQDISNTCIIYGEASSYAKRWADNFGCTFIATPMPIIIEAELELSEDGTTLLGVTNADKATVITIPDTVTTLGKNSLYYCKHVKALEIPSSVTTIEDYAFSQELLDIYIPPRVTSIGNQITSILLYIYGEVGSYAEQWATTAWREFIAVDK